MNDQKAFTGRTRRRSTSKGVVLADIVARFLISAGGIGTIIAVLGVCVFLVWVVVPLFQSAQVSTPEGFFAEGNDLPLHAAIDEYQTMGWVLLPDGRIRALRIDNGETVFEEQLFEGRTITCASFLIRGPEAAVGFDDGTVELMRIRFSTSYMEPEAMDEGIRAALEDRPRDTVATFGKGIVQLTQEGQYRTQELEIEPISSEKFSDHAIRLIDLVVRANGPLVCVLAGTQDAPEFKAISITEKEDFLSGELTTHFGNPVELPYEALAPSWPAFLEISGTGTNVYLAWEDGALMRLRCDSLRKAFIAEKGRLTEAGVEVTCLGFVLGESTLIWGDSEGGICGGFPVRVEELVGRGLYNVVRDPTKTLFAFALTKNLGENRAPVSSMGASGRSRLVLCGFADGTVRLLNPTNEGLLADVELEQGEAVTSLTVSPKEDGFVAVTTGGLHHCRLDPKYPEANMKALFLPVWYEGYPRPVHMWQSSSGTDDFEPKLGLVPLIFGTLKATFYAMLFGAPLALLAALYTSEFLRPRAKSVLKPAIELMASLPSVVLGFLAALVFAPFVEMFVPATLLLFVTLPFAFLLAAYLWQLAPGRLTRRLETYRPLFIVPPMVAGIVLALVAGPLMERLFFVGDFKGWLAWDGSEEGGYGSALGGWLLLTFPLSVLLSVFVIQPAVMPWMRHKAQTLGRGGMAWLDLLKFLAISIFTVGLALLISALLNQVGLDPRHEWLFLHTDFSPMDVYVQRNALIVGFVMGFAVIPIIYTLADDALSSVPEHLRSASLGCGATPWQTATRIVIPTAMSGLFSALMIGLGRAVGETMIVLMALGNTAIMDWNVFNGARTLSANIAVELPEAVRNSGHYRTLFLAALVLFAMTFVVNTIAEMVRLRFRRRSYQL